MARYVEDQVSVLIPKEARSIVTIASSDNPWKRSSNDHQVAKRMKSGEIAMVADLNGPIGESSNATLTSKNAADIDSRNCKIHNKSFGIFPDSIASN